MCLWSLGWGVASQVQGLWEVEALGHEEAEASTSVVSVSLIPPNSQQRRCWGEGGQLIGGGLPAKWGGQPTHGRAAIPLG